MGWMLAQEGDDGVKKTIYYLSKGAVEAANKTVKTIAESTRN